MKNTVVKEAPAAYGLRSKKNRTVFIEGTVVPKYMTEDEFVAWYEKQDDTVRAEWVAGEVIPKMPDNLEHNDFEGLFYKLISEFVNTKDLGRVFYSRIQTRLPILPSRREPDIFFVSKRREHILRETYVDGAPDWAMEVVSPSSSERDFRIKYCEYEEAGVREYWIVNPLDKSISVYALNAKGKYEIVPAKNGKHESKVVRGFYVREEWLKNPRGVRIVDALKEMGAI